MVFTSGDFFPHNSVTLILENTYLKVKYFEIENF